MSNYTEVLLRPRTAAQRNAVAQLLLQWGALDVDERAEADAANRETQVADASAPRHQPTLQEVRLRLTQLSRAGKADAVKSLLKQHGATNVTELDPAHYAAVLAAGGAL
jgi:hypothetical protein